MLGVLADEKGNVVAEHRMPTPYTALELVESMSALVAMLEASVEMPTIGVGVGAAGLVDRSGVLAYGPNVGGIAKFAVLEEMSAAMPNRLIVVENDNTCATWAEHHSGAGNGADEM